MQLYERLLGTSFARLPAALRGVHARNGGTAEFALELRPRGIVKTPYPAVTICAALAAIAALGKFGGAQTIAPGPMPAATACARPNSAATTIRAAMPDTPPIAQQQGIVGIVQVVVTLDADSNVVGARIQTSPSAVLNEAAIAAARASTFRTEVRDCVPRGGQFIFTVEFESPIRFSTSSSGARTVTVVARGVVTRAPDVAIVEVRIMTNGESAPNAAAKNDAVLDAIKARVLRFGITGAQITPTPLRSYPPTANNSGSGYMTTRNVDIISATVADAGKLANAAATIPEVDVVGTHYSLTDRTSARRDAISDAVETARKRAVQAATMQHARIGALKEVVVAPERASASPMLFIRFQRALNPQNPTGPSMMIPTLTVDAIATVTYAIEP